MLNELHDADTATVAQASRAVIKFWAPWCGPCKAFAPSVEQASERHADVPFYSVNVDAEPHLAQRFRVRGLPTLVGVRDGGVAFSVTGVVPAGELDRLVQTLA